MEKIILVPVDNSEHSYKALHYALDIAGHMNAKVTVLNVQPSFKTYNVSRFFSEAEIHQYQQELGEEALKKAKDQVHNSNVEVTYKLAIGDAKTEIVKLAKTEDAYSIVMGSRGHGPITGKLLGSVSYGVLHSSPCPVTIIP